MEIKKKLPDYYHKHKEQVKKLSFVFKLIFSIALLYFLFTKVSFKDTISHLIALPLSIVFLLIVSSYLKFYIQMRNWKSLLKIDPKVNIKKGDIFRTHTLGLLFKLIIPGGHGSFGKMFYLKQISKKSAFFIILLEKMFQTWIVWVAGLFACEYYFKAHNIVFFTLFLISIFIPLFIPYVFKKASSERKWRRYRRLVLPLMISQIVYLLLTFYQYYIILSFEHDVSIFDLVIKVSLVLFATLIPISYSGLGIRESASVYLFAQSNINAETAIACSLIIFFFNSVLPALPSLFYFYKEKKN
ncbi:MAG TPA: lysylphosphatidylglycerol synthase transmembrane domain-containing protein [Candidatus Cloacimonadota bacterium]|nr:lysylphosphatidylglycerol synthase transmembrane domain-containing protein [Candidatus Cloacimonadota bacterium]